MAAGLPSLANFAGLPGRVAGRDGNAHQHLRVWGQRAGWLKPPESVDTQKKSGKSGMGKAKAELGHAVSLPRCD